MLRGPVSAVAKPLARWFLAAVFVVGGGVCAGALAEYAIHQSSENAALAMKACDVSMRDWNAWQKVIATTRNPPTLRGKPITADERAALEAYARALSVDVGPKPTC
jgi:hypothetical protein